MRRYTRDELELRELAAARLEEKRRAARTDARQPTLLGNFFDAPQPSSSSSARARVAYLAKRHGLRVRCTDCGELARARCSSRARLRKQPCPACGGRLRPLAWGGWKTWRQK